MPTTGKKEKIQKQCTLIRCRDLEGHHYGSMHKVVILYLTSKILRNGILGQFTKYIDESMNIEWFIQNIQIRSKCLMICVSLFSWFVSLKIQLFTIK